MVNDELTAETAKPRAGLALLPGPAEPPRDPTLMHSTTIPVGSDLTLQVLLRAQSSPSFEKAMLVLEAARRARIVRAGATYRRQVEVRNIPRLSCSLGLAFLRLHLSNATSQAPNPNIQPHSAFPSLYRRRSVFRWLVLLSTKSTAGLLIILPPSQSNA